MSLVQRWWKLDQNKKNQSAVLSSDLLIEFLTDTEFGSGLAACREPVAPPNGGEAHQVDRLWWWGPGSDHSCSQWQGPLGIRGPYPRDAGESTGQHPGTFLSNQQGPLLFFNNYPAELAVALYAQRKAKSRLDSKVYSFPLLVCVI